ncbi:MAG: hypothetical protein PHR15_05625 [Atopobiaceae bacterium]|nr:hypothetical protein [Atopobiaceae bacterium]MDD4380942.1 hypothetical protein [Atopobiaceae bacterium]
MERKNKVMAVAAAGAVAILLLASVARCSATGRADTAAATEAATGEAAQTTAATIAGTPTATERLTSREWMSPDDAGKRMTLSDGRLVETDGTNTYTCSYEVVSDGTGGCELDVLRADGSRVTADVTVTGSGDGMRASSDAFQVSRSWVPAPEDGGTVTVTGVDQAYLDLVGGDEAALEAAVASWCSAHALAATEATFDGEVYLDTKAGDVTATLTCDDPGRTILSVTWADGAFSVAG